MRFNLPVTLQEHVVPAGVSIVDPQELLTLPRSTSAEEALALVPGVQVDNPLDEAGVRWCLIRGERELSAPPGDVDVLVDPYTGGTSGAVRVIMIQDADVKFRHAESFRKCVDISTT